MSEEEPETIYLGMAKISTSSIMAAGLAIDLFRYIDTATLRALMRSRIGLCDCGSKPCVDAIEIRKADPTPPQLPTLYEIDIMKEDSKLIADWLEELLNAGKDA